MLIQKAFATAKIIESLENYAKSDDWKAEEVATDLINPNGDYRIINDDSFWNDILERPDDFWEQTFRFSNVGISEWIARQPGLYYSGGSEILRQMAQSKEVYITDGWKHYSPIGKSQKVMGGVGSINLPPNEEGWHLISISTTNNASTGIPALVSPEVWEYHKLGEGKWIRQGEGKWRKMANGWVSRFPSTEGIPKGYIVLDNPDNIEVEDIIMPTIYHPFTIMEYEQENAKFYDYVYVTVDSSQSDFRSKIRNFFGEYKYFENRNGQYLIEPFIHNPLINDNDILYQSPSDLRRMSPESKSHLALMVERIQSETFNGKTIEAIKIAIDNNTSINQLRRISQWIKIHPNKWHAGRSVQDESATLIDICRRSGKLEELVDALIKENQQIFFI